jgi:predicted dehydrogenase
MDTGFFPDPRIPEPGLAPSFNWGVAGPGRIAEVFASSMQHAANQRLRAVASRSAERGKRFAQRFSVDRVYSSYQELFSDPLVDIVYIATPNSLHVDQGLAAMAAGKHVVIEKPLTVDAAETQCLMSAADRHGRFLMEGMWPRFLPSWDSLRQIIDNGDVGEIYSLDIDIGKFFSEKDPDPRIFTPELGGGVLLDLGVYVVAASSFLMGSATSCSAHGQLTSTGVDAQVGFSLEHSSNRLTSAFATLRGKTPTQACLIGSRGTIWVGAPWYFARHLTFIPHTGPSVERTFDVDSQLDGFAYEIAEAARCVDKGLPESPYMPLAESYRIQCVLETLRRQIGRGDRIVAT